MARVRSRHHKCPLKTRHVAAQRVVPTHQTGQRQRDESQRSTQVAWDVQLSDITGVTCQMLTQLFTELRVGGGRDSIEFDQETVLDPVHSNLQCGTGSQTLSVPRCVVSTLLSESTWQGQGSENKEKEGGKEEPQPSGPKTPKKLPLPRLRTNSG